MLPTASAWAAAFAAASAAGLLCLHLELAPRPSAQISMGVMGFVGGGLTARVASRTGAGLDMDASAIVAVVWSLVCMVAVTPLFYFSATPVQLAVRTVMLFTFAGAAGSLMTLGTLWPRAAAGGPRTVFYGAMWWTAGFSAAAFVVSVGGPAAAKALPPPAGPMVASVGALGLAGAGAGLALKAQATERRLPWQGLGRLSGAVASGRVVIPAAAAAAMAAPFYINDIANITIHDWRPWLVVDVLAVKCLPLAIWFWVVKKEWWTPMGLGRQHPPLATVLLAGGVAALFGVFIDQHAAMIFGRFPGWSRLGQIPEITSVPWRWIDITAGLAAVAVVEELVFRGVAAAVLLRVTRNPLVIIAASAAAFGMIHWSGGMSQVLSTATVGALFMALYLETGSLPAVMSAHFIVNVVDAAGLMHRALGAYL